MNVRTLAFLFCNIYLFHHYSSATEDFDYGNYYDNNENSGVAIDFVTIPPDSDIYGSIFPGLSKKPKNISLDSSEEPSSVPGLDRIGGALVGALFNNPITRASQKLFEALGLNTKFSVNANPEQGLTIDRELGAFGLNHRDTDNVAWTKLGPAFRKTQTLDAYGAELGKLAVENRFRENKHGAVEFHGCNQGDLFGGIFSRCNRLNGLRSSTYNNRFDPTGIGRFFQDIPELLSILNSRRRKRRNINA